LISDKYNQDDYNVFVVAGILLICGKLWVGNRKPSEESEGFVIETKTNDCPSFDGKEILPL